MAQQKTFISLDFKTGLSLYLVVRRLQDNRWFDYTTKSFLEEADITSAFIPLAESTIATTTYTCELDVADSWNGDYLCKIYSKVGSVYTAVSNEVLKTFYNGIIQNQDDNLLHPAQMVIDGFSTIMSTLAEASVDTGTVTSSAAQTEFTDTGKDWETDMWKNTIFSIVTASDGLEHLGLVLSNTSDTLTFADIGTPIAAGDFYQIKLKISTTSIHDINGAIQTPRDLTADMYTMLPGNTSSINKVTVVASTEGSFTLPNDTRSWTIVMEDGLPGEYYYFSWTTGEVATGAGNSAKIEGNYSAGEDRINYPSGRTMYFATPKVGGATFVIFATNIV